MSAAPPGFDSSKEAREAALNRTRRELLLEGARRVFNRDGLDGASMRAIATEAGCTTGAIYPHFSSKEEIYAELLAESLERLHECVRGAVSAAPDPGARLKAAALSFLGYYREKPDEVALGLYLWHGLRPRGLSPRLDDALNERRGRTLGLLRDSLQTLGDLSESSARLEASILFAFLIGALIVHQTGRLRLLDTDLNSVALGQIDPLLSRLRCSEDAGGSRPDSGANANLQ